MKHHLYPSSTTFSPDPATVMAFDLEGRLLSLFQDGTVYKRDLSSQVHLRQQQQGSQHPGRQRGLFTPAQASQLFTEVHQRVHQHLPELPEDLQERLQQVWPADRLMNERKRFLEVYQPISILPPDQYLSVVLQATEGCTWNKCTFCNFYADRPFRVKTLSEFEAHVQGVQDLLGRGTALRKSVFLADGNALAIHVHKLASMLQVATGAFPGLPIASFIDVFTGSRHTVQEWKHLRELGLRRVFIGMESGLDRVLNFINKPGSAAEMLEFVHELKTAGLEVGLIVMVGVGGQELREDHAKATLDLLAQMPLDPTDLVYLSPFVEHPGFTYSEKREAWGLTPMAEWAVEQELTHLAKQVRGLGFKAARYDIREFLY